MEGETGKDGLRKYDKVRAKGRGRESNFTYR